MRLIGAIMAAGLATVLPAHAESLDARQVLPRWVEAFNAGKPDDVAALYTADATVWGTLAPTLATSPEVIRSYFTAAAKAGLKVRLLGDVVSRLSDDVLVETGRYEFLRIQNGQETVFPARYTFVLVKQGDGWKIAHQHSSLMPKPAS